jgi:hypothetical protein
MITTQPPILLYQRQGKFLFSVQQTGHYAKMELLSVGYEPFAGPTPGKADL